MADELEQRLRALRSKDPAPPSKPAAKVSPTTSSRSSNAPGPVDDDDEVERYLRQMSPPLDLPPLPSSSSPSSSRLDKSLDATDAAARLFTGPMAEVTFIPAPPKPGTQAQRTAEEEEALIRRLQDQLLVEDRAEADGLADRLRRLRGDGVGVEDDGEAPGPPPVHDPGVFSSQPSPQSKSKPKAG